MEKRQARSFNFLVPGVELEEFSTPGQTTGEHLGHLKDLEISKYKRESKTRMPEKMCYLWII